MSTRAQSSLALSGLVAVILNVTAPVGAQTSPEAGHRSDAQVRQILADRVDTHRQSVGIVVGVIEPGGRRVITHGQLAKGDSRVLDGRTVFEVGSITKVFTALLLAEAVRRGEVSLTDPVAKYLPASVTMPGRNARSITLQHLANHTSGLPRLPTNLAPKNPADPYADYTADNLYAFLSSYQLTRDIGAEFEDRISVADCSGMYWRFAPIPTTRRSFGLGSSSPSAWRIRALRSRPLHVRASPLDTTPRSSQWRIGNCRCWQALGRFGPPQPTCSRFSPPCSVTRRLR